MLCQMPGFHYSRLAVTLTSMYSSLATTSYMRCVKYSYMSRILSSKKCYLLKARFNLDELYLTVYAH